MKVYLFSRTDKDDKKLYWNVSAMFFDSRNTAIRVFTKLATVKGLMTKELKSHYNKGCKLAIEEYDLSKPKIIREEVKK